MDIKEDICTRADIERLLIHFYERVKQDDTIGFIFTEIVNLNWNHHIPVIADFWETILLDNPVYKKNAMEVHYALNEKVHLQKEYFERWLYLFNSSIDALFNGRKAELAKTRAASIAGLMQFRINKKAGPLL